MICEKLVGSGDLELRHLRRSDIEGSASLWLRRTTAQELFEIASHDISEEQLIQAVERINESKEKILYGIFIGGGRFHVGNIKLTIWEEIDRWGELEIEFFDYSLYPEDCASQAILTLSNFVESHLDLCEIRAFFGESDESVYRSFVNAGFESSAIASSHVDAAGDVVQRSPRLIRRRRPSLTSLAWTAGPIDTIVFIGGGLLMARCMDAARELGFRAVALLAKRHAGEEVEAGVTLAEHLSQRGQHFQVIGAVFEIDPVTLFGDPGRCLALCFGPDWIFPETVRYRFSGGMLNFNGIPIPRYLGGAHYTWQILNGYRRSGCHIQLITDQVDRGDIILSESFELPSWAANPVDYFHLNDTWGYKFLKEFLQKLSQCATFQGRSFDEFEKERLYFPRLASRDNGWIDWSWTGEEILRFCNGFSFPYPGASTLYKGCRLFVKRAVLVRDAEHLDFHPFCVGLIVRASKSYFTVVVRDALFQIHDWAFEGEPQLVREGERLDTPSEILSYARLYRPRR